MNKVSYFLSTCLSPKKAFEYLASQDEAFLDIFLYIVFVIQTFALVALPSEHDLSMQTQWGRYSIWVIFFIAFYPYYYLKYYKNNNRRFIRDIVILSVPSRVLAFLSTSAIAITAAFLKSKFKSMFSSFEVIDMTVLFQAVYYAFFSFFMIKVRK